MAMKSPDWETGLAEVRWSTCSPAHSSTLCFANIHIHPFEFSITASLALRWAGPSCLRKKAGLCSRQVVRLSQGHTKRKTNNYLYSHTQTTAANSEPPSHLKCTCWGCVRILENLGRTQVDTGGTRPLHIGRNQSSNFLAVRWQRESLHHRLARLANMSWLQFCTTFGSKTIERRGRRK